MCALLIVHLVLRDGVQLSTREEQQRGDMDSLCFWGSCLRQIPCREIGCQAIPLCGPPPIPFSRPAASPDSLIHIPCCLGIRALT